MPFLKDECKITFTKPYKVVEDKNYINLKVAKKASKITFSADCYWKRPLAGDYGYMPYNNENFVKYRINKLPDYIVLKGKHINQTGVFNTKNSKEVILANLNRKFKKAKYFPIGLLGKKDYEFMKNNNLETDNFKYVYYVQNKHGAKIFIASHIDPTSKGSRVYYLVTDAYPIKSDGVPHTTKKEFESAIKKFKETVNQ